MRRTVSLATLGCKTNQFESAAMQERLLAAGYEVIPFEGGADLVIVNTCTVTAATDAQSRNLIRRARRFNPECRVVVTGCYAQIDPQTLARLPGVSLVIGNEEKSDFLSRLEGAGEGRVEVGDIRSVESACVLPLASWGGRSRAFVQIQNGCDAFCSYCIIPYARGVSRSVVPDKVTDQVNTLHAQGSQEIVLTGIHVGAYGLDLSPATSLAALVRRIETETSLTRLRLGSIEPLEFSDELIDTLVTSEIVCRHLHIPLQAGDDAVLERMNRHYTRRDFRKLVELLAVKMPRLAIGLDVITGFPGETDREFSNTLSLLEVLPISSLHVFPFSRRPGTPAATMPGQLPADVIKERAARLRELGDSRQRDFARQFVGERLEVVVEAGLKEGASRGLSREYLDVRFNASESDVGSVRSVLVEALRDDGVLSGRLVGNA